MHSTLAVFAIFVSTAMTFASYLLFAPLTPPSNFAELVGYRVPNDGSCVVQNTPAGLSQFLWTTGSSSGAFDSTVTAAVIDTNAEEDDGAEADKEADEKEGGEEKEETALDRIWTAPKLG